MSKQSIGDAWRHPAKRLGVRTGGTAGPPVEIVPKPEPGRSSFRQGCSVPQAGQPKSRDGDLKSPAKVVELHAVGRDIVELDLLVSSNDVGQFGDPNGQLVVVGTQICG